MIAESMPRERQPEPDARTRELSAASTGAGRPEAKAPLVPRRRPVLRALGRGLGSAAVWFVVLVAIMPVLVMVRIALTPSAAWTTMPIDWFAPPVWDSFARVLGGTFPVKMVNSLIVSLASTFVVVALSAVAGYALVLTRSRHKERFLFIVLGTRMGPAVVFALPLFLLVNNLGLIDTHLALIIVYSTYNLAFGIWMMHGFFVDVDFEIIESALVEGLGDWGAFLRVALPMATSGVIATATLVFIFCWNEFFYAFVLTRLNAATFPTAIPGYFGAFTVEWGGMFAASTLGVLPAVVFGILVRRWLARGLSGGLVD